MIWIQVLQAIFAALFMNVGAYCWLYRHENYHELAAVPWFVLGAMQMIDYFWSEKARHK